MGIWSIGENLCRIQAPPVNKLNKNALIVLFASLSENTIHYKTSELILVLKKYDMPGSCKD
jgi:hypothetical protein